LLLGEAVAKQLDSNEYALDHWLPESDWCIEVLHPTGGLRMTFHFLAFPNLRQGLSE
jgi:hypothetical protein